MRKFRLLTALVALLATLAMSAQSRDYSLTLNVSGPTGDPISDATVTLTQTDYSLSYGTLTLTNGALTTKVYAGNHRLEVTLDGYNDVTETFNITGDTTIAVRLTEMTQVPRNLGVSIAHNAQTALNDVTLSWNKEEPVFFDDFESYEAFATEFGEWTGIDGDGLVAAPLVGNYINRAVTQYAQIMNPLVVEPAWWYDYPILRPYSGQQYVGFTRTYSGEANDDWLISPVITPGHQNSLTFMAKAADIYKEKFQVYVTTVVDNTTRNDFVKISSGNYETVDYKGWHTFTYDLSDYEGKPIKFAIRFISASNNGGSFMLMVDDVRVGQVYTNATSGAPRQGKAKRVAARSPMNPYESFNVYLNGNKVGTTEDYEYTFADLAAGTYTLGVQAVYPASTTEIVDTVITIVDQSAVLTVNVTTNNNASADSAVVELYDIENDLSYSTIVENGVAKFPSLPWGKYMLGVTAEHFEVAEMEFNFSADTTINIVLQEVIVDPYNITTDIFRKGINNSNVDVAWNQNLSFKDSFEDYDDFAQGTFGEWRSYDLDGHNVYPIGLGSSTNIVTFPGASTPSSPQPIAPIVFNPWNTVPAMMPTDLAVMAPTGDKTVAFFSPQSNGANKWLVSPKVMVREDFVCRITAKAYAAYTESMEVCVFPDPDDANPNGATYEAVANIPDVTTGQWTIYETDLANYVGKEVRIGIHYTTYDGFFAQIDDFYVGNLAGDSTAVDVGLVDHYIIWLDGVQVGTSTTPTFTLTNVTDGHHTVTIQAIYTSGASQAVSQDFDISLSGDVNLDGKVDSGDLSCIVKIITGKEKAGTYGNRDDLNGDNLVNAGDIDVIVNIITKQEQ